MRKDQVINIKKEKRVHRTQSTTPKTGITNAFCYINLLPVRALLKISQHQLSASEQMQKFSTKSLVRGCEKAVANTPESRMKDTERSSTGRNSHGLPLPERNFAPISLDRAGVAESGQCDGLKSYCLPRHTGSNSMTENPAPGVQQSIPW